MKKILLIFVVCMSFLAGYGQNVIVSTALNNSKEVEIGSITSFTVKVSPSPAATTDTYMEIVGEIGFFCDSQGKSLVSIDPKKSYYIYRGDKIVNNLNPNTPEVVYIKWRTAKTGTVYLRVNAGITKLYEETWKDIVVKPIENVSVVGETSVMAGEEITYSLSRSLGSLPINWDIIPSSYAQIIGSTTSSTVKIKPLQTSGSFTIRASVTNTGQFFEKTITTYPPIEIKVSTVGYVCLNDQITYSIQIPSFYSSPKIEWLNNIGNQLILLSGQGTQSATFKVSSGNGYVFAKAKVVYQGKEYTVQSPPVWVGAPGTGSLDVGNGSTVVAKNPYTFYANMEGTDIYTTYKWVKDSGMGKFMVSGDDYGSGDCVTIVPTGAQGSFFEFHVDATNYCGTTRKYFWVIVNSGFDTRSASIEEVNNPEIKSVKIYNLSGVLVYSDNAVNGSFDIKSTVLTDGIYIIEKSDGQNRTSEKVMLKR